MGDLGERVPGLEPDVLPCRFAFDAPVVGHGVDQEEASAAGVFRAGLARYDQELAVVAVVDLDPHDALVQADHEEYLGVLVDNGVGDQLAGEELGDLDQVLTAPPAQGVVDERPASAGTRRSPGRVVLSSDTSRSPCLGPSRRGWCSHQSCGAGSGTATVEHRRDALVGHPEHLGDLADGEALMDQGLAEGSAEPPADVVETTGAPG